MLPRQHRLNHSAELRQVIRRGRRFAIPGAAIFVVIRNDEQPSRLGIVTPKIVGNSVTRHLVARRIRHSFFAVIKKHPFNLDVAIRAGAESEKTQLNHWENAIFAAIEKAERKNQEQVLNASSV